MGRSWGQGQGRGRHQACVLVALCTGGGDGKHATRRCRALFQGPAARVAMLVHVEA